MQLVSIGVIARQAGVATSTIRYYERIRLLPPPKRGSGKRQYDSSILKKLGIIRVAQRAGFTIAEIQNLVHGFSDDAPPSKQWQSSAKEKIVELEGMIVQIQAMKLMLQNTLQEQCTSLEDCSLEKYQGADSIASPAHPRRMRI